MSKSQFCKTSFGPVGTLHKLCAILQLVYRQTSHARSCSTEICAGSWILRSEFTLPEKSNKTFFQKRLTPWFIYQYIQTTCSIFTLQLHKSLWRTPILIKMFIQIPLLKLSKVYNQLACNRTVSQNLWFLTNI